MQVSSQSTILRYGAINGFVGVILFVAGSVTGLMDFSNVMSSALFGLISMAISIAIIVYGIQQYRDTELGGQISFGQGFITALGISIVGILLSTIGQYLYTSIIDPTFYETMAEQMNEMFEKLNVPETAREEALEQIRNSGTLSIMLINGAKVSGFMAVVSLIIAAIMKKQPASNPFDKM